MSRLASLTPSRSAQPSPSPSPAPSRSSRSSTPTPAAPTVALAKSRYEETTYHRMIKLIIAEFKVLFKTWDEVVLVDGLKAGKGCIDEATEMDNIIQMEETEARPSVLKHYTKLQQNRAALDGVLVKLDKLLLKLNMLIDQAEKIYFEAFTKLGWEFVAEEPLWLTWTLQYFINSLPRLFTVHNQHLATLTGLAEELKSSETSFDDARLTLETWRDFGYGGERYHHVREWEELVEIETTMGQEVDEDEDEDDMPVKRSGKKKGKK